MSDHKKCSVCGAPYLRKWHLSKCDPCHKAYTLAWRQDRRLNGPRSASSKIGPARQFYENALEHSDAEQCLIWPFARSHGYGSIKIDGRLSRVSRLVCETINGAPPSPGHQAAHSCGNGQHGCINPYHLRWATPTENSADARAHGTLRLGERSPAASLTNDQAREIFKLKGSASRRALAEKFGVSTSTIGAIQKGQRYVSAVMTS